MKTGGIRFAPSPTGTFHVGNLRTAWVSWSIAQGLGLRWVARFEDIDGPRVLPGSQASQLADLATLGLVPDEVLVQSGFHGRHLECFEAARRAGQVYPCSCSRKEVLTALQQAASAPHGEVPLYSGHCRRAFEEGRQESATHSTLAWRFKASNPDGTQDFIVARTAGREGVTDFAPSYNWACAIDDWDGAYDLLVRAWDLAPVAEQQRAIQSWLRNREGATRALPALFHTALVTRDSGERLEKRTRGVTLAELRAAGHEPQDILERFARSLHDRLGKIEPGSLRGERARTLTLKELGLREQTS